MYRYGMVIKVGIFYDSVISCLMSFGLSLGRWGWVKYWYWLIVISVWYIMVELDVEIWMKVMIL